MRAIVVYSHNQSPDGNLNDQTRARCRRALKIYRETLFLSEPFIFIVNGVEKNKILLAEKMRDYFLRHEIPAKRIIVRPSGLNTAGETDTCIMLFKKVRPTTVAIVSSWYHVPRIHFLWHVRGWSVTSYASYGGISLYDVFIEPLKFLNSCLRPFASARFRS